MNASTNQQRGGMDWTQDNNNLSSMTLRDYIRVLFRQKSIVLTTFLTVVAVVFLGLLLQTPMYEARVKMLISGEKQVQAPYYRELGGDRNIAQSVTQSEVVISGPVLERVVASLALHKRPEDYELKYASPLKKLVIKAQIKLRSLRQSHLSPAEKEELAFRETVDGLKKSLVRVAPIRDTNLFTIAVQDVDPVTAAITANVVSRSYIIFDLEQQLAELTLKYGEKHPSVQQLKDNIARLLKSLNGTTLPNIDAIGPASVKIIEQAPVPLKPVGQSRTLILLLGIMMSALLALTLAFVFDYMDPTFKTPGEIEQELDFPILGSVPKRHADDKKLVHPSEKKSNSARFYQVLCDQIYLLIKDRSLRSILLTAADAEEGSSIVIANLGVFLSERAGCDVLLLDANFRNPALHSVFKMGNTLGFSDIIEGKAQLKDVVKEASKKLHVLTAGVTSLNPTILLDSPKAKEALAEVMKKYQIVLVDGPNLAYYRDSISLAMHTDAVAIVITEGQTRRLVVKAALQPLLERKTNILGVIVNNRTFSIPAFLYHRL